MASTSEARSTKSSENKIIPSPTLWDVQAHKDQGLYCWMKSISEMRPNSRAIVEGFGEMIILGGYSYLGLLQHPRICMAAKAAIDEFGMGTYGSRFLCGTLSLHDELEKTIAEFKKTEDAVVFSTGYVTNLSVLSCLLRQGDFLLCDRMNHASVIDGCLNSRANLVRFKHNDMESLEKCLKACPDDARKLVVSDAVFSMDGDMMDLPNVSRLCKQYSAYLMVDEAHAVGVLGKNGTGIEEFYELPYDTIDIKMGTLSKAIPSSGGYVAGTKELCTFLRHESRSFIYSGSPTPASTAAAIEGFKVIKDSPQLIQQLREKSEYFKELLRKTGFDVGLTQSPIVPIIVRDVEPAAKLAKFAQDHGILVQAVYPPVVPTGTARLRTVVMADHLREDLERAVKVLELGARQLGIL
jgi:8-amino-7-oxononanoate synthase